MISNFFIKTDKIYSYFHSEIYLCFYSMSISRVCGELGLQRNFHSVALSLAMIFDRKQCRSSPKEQRTLLGTAIHSVDFLLWSQGQRMLNSLKSRVWL